MKILAKLFRLLGNLALISGILIILIGSFSVLYFNGWGKFIDLFNPFNIGNHLAVLLTLLPGMIFRSIGNKIDPDIGKFVIGIEK